MFSTIKSHVVSHNAWQQVTSVLAQKPRFFFLISLAYLILAGFLKWNIRPDLGTGFYIIGGILGVYFLDIAERFFQLNPSPFRTIVFSWIFAIVCVFIVTSSGSMLASGLVLSLYLSIILWQVGEWRLVGNLTSWYKMVRSSPSVRIQKWILVGFIGVFILNTVYFIR